MRRKKIKIKKLKLPLKKMAKQEKDYAAVLLEDVNSNMKVIIEGLESVRITGENTIQEVVLIKEDISGIKLEMSEMKSDIVEMKSDIVEIKSEIIGINGRLTNIEKEIASIKYEINELKILLTQKADVEKLESLEIRIKNIENHLKLSTVN